jgi:hypothetical protein
MGNRWNKRKYKGSIMEVGEYGGNEEILGNEVDYVMGLFFWF